MKTCGVSKKLPRSMSGFETTSNSLPVKVYMHELVLFARANTVVYDLYTGIASLTVTVMVLLPLCVGVWQRYGQMLSSQTKAGWHQSCPFLTNYPKQVQSLQQTFKLEKNTTTEQSKDPDPQPLPLDPLKHTLGDFLLFLLLSFLKYILTDFVLTILFLFLFYRSTPSWPSCS